MYLVTCCGEHGSFRVNRNVGDRSLVGLNNVDDLKSQSIENQNIARRSMRIIASIFGEGRGG